MASPAKTKTDDSLSMKMTCFGIRKKFGKVLQVSTQELADWMNQGKTVTLLVRHFSTSPTGKFERCTTYMYLGRRNSLSWVMSVYL